MKEMTEEEWAEGTKELSIELGFKGETPIEFFEKLASVKKVRRRLKLELAGFILMGILFVATALTENIPVAFRFMSVVFFFLCLALSLRITLVFVDIQRVKKQRYLEYYIEKGLDENGNKT